MRCRHPRHSRQWKRRQCFPCPGLGVSGCIANGAAHVPYTLLLEALLEVVLGHIGLLVPHVLLSRSVDLGELVLVGANLVGGLLGGVGGNVADENGGIAH